MRAIFCFEMKELKGGERIKRKGGGRIIDKSINSFEIMATDKNSLKNR